MHLNMLRQLLGDNRKRCLFTCIKDLVTNGLKLERFSDEGSPPSRQDITQYLASWCKYTGMSADECREWMIEYCISVLSVLSSSSNSRIRHSTKCNIKYIYNSDVNFECRREENAFKAECDSKCPVYKEMVHVAKELKTPDVVQPSEAAVECSIGNELIVPGLSVKETYREQFEKAMAVVRNRLEQGVSKQEIVRLLNERGLKTRTGRKWSYSILANELRQSNNKQE